MFWRIQKSYTENPTWNTESYPYQYLSSPTSGLSYQHDCDLNVDPYNNGNHQYETRPSNEQNSCVDNKQWMGWVLRNANSTDPNRTSLGMHLRFQLIMEPILIPIIFSTGWMTYITTMTFSP